MRADTVRVHLFVNPRTIFFGVLHIRALFADVGLYGLLRLAGHNHNELASFRRVLSGAIYLFVTSWPALTCLGQKDGSPKRDLR